ncbi:adenylosuccinate synthase [Thermodesulfobacteriota bacterium]
MPAQAVVGANWGDEGKGKIIDFLAGQADMVVRFQGGQNAGHTIINSYGKFIMHLLPSGVFYPDVVNVLGPGVALDMKAFLAELESLKDMDIPDPRIFISDRAQIVLPTHVLFDRYEEERLEGDKFGSTQKGIAPFYADKYMKLGIQVADLYDKDRLQSRLERSLTIKNVLLRNLYSKPLLSASELANDLFETAERISPFVSDTTSILHQALMQDKHILLEGQLGALRDPDHGIYPFSTSSSPLAGFASVGAGIPPHTIKPITAITKSYSTCVGAGPFVTELLNDEAKILRDRGGDTGEYGATTGRPRRVGWFDAVATRYGCRLQGATEVALSMLDVLGYLDEIPLCIAYEIDGLECLDFPAPVKLEKSRPVYEILKGWKCDISQIRSFNALPSGARRYVRRIEELIRVPIRWISVGPHRDDVIPCH